VAFRIITGIAVGASALVVPMYIAEMAPVRIRGGLVILQQLAISGGILISYLLDFAFDSAGWGWRPMFAAAVLPAVALAIGMLLMSHSPRWLGMRGRWDEAGAVLSISPLFWLMSAEVFPNRLRGAGASASTVANWSANLLITVTFLSLINAVGKSWTFWIYAIFAGAGHRVRCAFRARNQGPPAGKHRQVLDRRPPLAVLRRTAGPRSLTASPARLEYFR
jgi:MFS family permease